MQKNAFRVHWLMALLTVLGLFVGMGPVIAGQAPVEPSAAEPATVTFRLASGKDVVGEIVSEDKSTVVIFNGAGNLALRTADIQSRRPGGELEATSGSKGGLVTRVQPRAVSEPLTAVGSAETATAKSVALARSAGTLVEVLREPESHLDQLASAIRQAGVGPALIELESIYHVRPVNRAEAYATLEALEKKAGEWLRPIAAMNNQEVLADLQHSRYVNEETFTNGKAERLTGADARQLLALRRLVHGINKDTYYIYSVHATFTDILNPRRPMGDCNSSSALIYHLAWKYGYGAGLALFEDKAGHHAVLAMTCANDGRHYFAETTGGYLSGNRAYQKLAEDPTTMEKTVISSLLNEGYPPGLSALDNLRLATILRVTSPDAISRNNFKHYFISFLNGCLDRHDQTTVAQWSAVYDRIEGVGAFAKLPRAMVPRP